MFDDDSDMNVGEPVVDEATVLGLVSHMRANCAGLEGSDTTLDADRSRNQRYMRGDMFDMPVDGDNRSKVTDSLSADTVATAEADLIEIFTDEEVVSFPPLDDSDVEQAKLETNLVRWIIFEDNDGWSKIQTAIQDALVLKTGVFKYWVEVEEIEDRQPIQDVSDGFDVEMFNATNAEGLTVEALEDGTFERVSVTKRVRAKFSVVRPEDFGTSDDGQRVQDNDYVIHRSHPRLQDLRGEYPDELIEKLSRGEDEDNDIDQARDKDTVDAEEGDNLGDFARVTLHEHYIRANLDGEDIKLWKVTTDSGDSVLLDIEEVARTPFAAITPFPKPHRFIGESLVDKTIEKARIKTNLTRQMVDSGNFAMNQRMEVAEDKSNEYTMDDLMDNDPGQPIRSQTGDAVRAIQAGQLGFDVLSALEYTSTQAEQQSGVGRQTMGLNADSLHETATGQQNLMSRSMRRVRTMARAMAETGFRDLCLGLHAVLRDSGEGVINMPSGQGMRAVDLSALRRRDEMRVTIGAGSRQETMASLMQLISLSERIIEMQGGLDGPMIGMDGVSALLNRFTDTLAIRGMSDIWMLPEQYQAPPPQPDPEVIKAQTDGQLKMRELAMKEQEMRMEQERRDRELDAKILNDEKRLLLETRIAEMRMELQAIGQTQPPMRPGGSLAA